MQENEYSKKELYDVIRQQKELNRRKREIFIKLADPERGRKMFAAIDKLHKGILDYDGDLDDVVMDILEDEGLFEFFKKYIHRPFFRSVEVFDNHRDNENQKRMVRGGYMMRNEFKRHTTAGHHVSTILKAKAMDNLQKQVDELKMRVSQQGTQLNYLHSGMIEVADNVSVLNSVVLQNTENQEDTKIKLHKAKSDNPSLSFRKLGKMFGISKNTAMRWYKEIDAIVSQEVSHGVP